MCSLVRHAYENVPYYRELLSAHGVHPDDIRSVVDLARIPISGKEDLQRDPDAFLSRGVRHERLVRHATSGSTGQPVVVFCTVREEHLRHVRNWRVDIEYGVRPGDRLARLTMPGRGKLPVDRGLLQLLSATRLFRQIDVDCREPPDRILARLRAFRPTLARGLAGALGQMAHAALADSGPPLRLRYVRAGGEVLTPATRQCLSRAFGAPVYDVYASNEFNLVAWQCPTSGLYHVADDTLILEVLVDGRPARDGESGEVVGTNLDSFAMPFLRFRLGDLVVKGPDRCPCGRRWSTLREIRGRVLEHFRLPGGRLLHPFSLPVGLTPWVRNFVLRQERTDRIVADVVPAPGCTPEQLKELDERVRAVLGSDVDFALRLVREIRPEASGKFQPYRPLVS